MTRDTAGFAPGRWTLPLHGLSGTSRGRVGQAVGFGVSFARDVGDGKLQRTGQLATDPVQGIKAWAAAGVLAAHLPDDHLGVRINVQRLGFKRQGALQGFQQSDVFGDIIVLAADPPGDADGAAGRPSITTPIPDGPGFPREPPST